MYCCAFPTEAILLVFAISGVFSGEMSGCSNPNDPKKVCLKDFKLDILLMFDQSATMSMCNYEKFRTDLRDMVNAYFNTKGAEDTQFAVLGCGKPEIMHLFKYGNFKIAIPNVILNIRDEKRTNDNLDMCSELAVSDIFTQENGDRDDAKNIALWISDCDFWEPDAEKEMMYGRIPRWKNSAQRHWNASNELQFYKKVDFFFICCKDTVKNAFRHDRKDDPYKVYDKMLYWLHIGHKDKESIIKYDYDSEKLSKEIMGKIITEKEVDIVDCVAKEIIVNCSYDTNVGQCVEGKIYMVEQHPFPMDANVSDKRGKDCPKNETKPCTGCKILVDQTSDEERAGNQDAVADKKTSVIWIVVGVVGGLVALLIMIVVLAMLVARRRRKQKMNKQQSSTKQEKGKGVQADLPIQSESKALKTSKKMSMKSKKSTVESVKIEKIESKKIEKSKK